MTCALLNLLPAMMATLALLIPATTHWLSPLATTSVKCVITPTSVLLNNVTSQPETVTPNPRIVMITMLALLIPVR
jgi:hypothetical protein